MAKFFQRIKQIFSSNTGDHLIKLIGTDRFQNRFYERLPGHRYYDSARRFYEPADYSNVQLRIDPAWEAWLRGTRKNPPTLTETLQHEAKRQQLAAQSTPMSPTSYGIKSSQGGTNSFPLREMYELRPGSKSNNESDSDKTF